MVNLMRFPTLKAVKVGNLWGPALEKEILAGMPLKKSLFEKKTYSAALGSFGAQHWKREALEGWPQKLSRTLL